jgi:hypothetical protein
MTEPLAFRAGSRATGTGVDCPEGVFAFRRPLERFKTLGCGLDGSNAAREEVRDLRARFVESTVGGDLPLTRRENE